MDTGKPDDRVYLLTFKAAPARRVFFWMQDGDKTKDQERETELNRLMNQAVQTTAPAANVRR